MPLMPAYVEMIHAKLLLTYGAAWKAAQGGITPEMARKHWAHELDGIGHEAITWALRNLPPNNPPNVLQFRALCNTRPAPVQKLLPAPRDAMSEQVRQKLAQAKAGARMADRLAWAKSLRQREQNGERLTLTQREAWRVALRVKQETE